LGTLNLAGGNFVINTDTLTISGTGGTLFTGVADDQNSQAAPGVVPEIAVFSFDQITLDPTATIDVTGTRALGLLSRGDATIGTDLRLDGRSFGLFDNPGGPGGPGGFAGGGGFSSVDANTNLPDENGRGPGGGVADLSSSRPLSSESQGGSGSFGGLGFGRDENVGDGVTYGGLTQRLQGGSGGAAERQEFAGTDPVSIAGAGGGGALDIAATGDLLITATLSANGGNGQSQFGLGAISGSGSGGGIRLSGDRVVIDGAVEALGGFRDVGANYAVGGGGRVFINEARGTPVHVLGRDYVADALVGIDVSNLARDTGFFSGSRDNPPSQENLGVITLTPERLIVDSSRTYTLGELVRPTGTDQNVELLIRDITVTDAGELLADGDYRNNDTLEFGGPDTALLGTGTLANAGSLTGTATIAPTVDNLDGGEIATIGGQLSFTQNVANLAGGQVNGINGTFDFAAGLDNLGELNLINTTVTGDVTNNGTVALAGDNTFTGSVTGSGDFTGTGLGVFTGSTGPGNSPGLVEFAGDVTYTDTHSLLIELAGDGGVAGTDFDQITVAGELELDGGLSVTLLGGFLLEAGDEFLILTAGSSSGTFAGLGEGATVGSFSGVDLQITYAGGDGNDVALFVVPEPTAGLLLAAGLPLMLRRGRPRVATGHR
jgi:hypothetical protein